MATGEGDRAASGGSKTETTDNDRRIADRFAVPRSFEVRYVEERFSAILRELSRFRSYSVAWEAFDNRGCVSFDDTGVARGFTSALELGEAYYRQFFGSDDLVAPLPLYYGSMWFARAVINTYEYTDDLGRGLVSHGMAAKFPNLEAVDGSDYYDELSNVLAKSTIAIPKDGRLSIFSEALGGDSLRGVILPLSELLASIPELDGIAGYGTRHARVYLRENDYSGFDKAKGLPTRAGFDYRLPESGSPIDAPPEEFDQQFALAPAFKDRRAQISMRQVHFDLRGSGPEDDVRTLTLWTPQGLYLERRLSTGHYIPEPVIHLAIQHALSELVRYHPLTWLAMADESTEEYALIREFMTISSRKFPLLVLDELAWRTFDFRRH